MLEVEGSSNLLDMAASYSVKIRSDQNIPLVVEVNLHCGYRGMRHISAYLAVHGHEVLENKQMTVT